MTFESKKKNNRYSSENQFEMVCEHFVSGASALPKKASSLIYKDDCDYCFNNAVRVFMYLLTGFYYCMNRKAAMDWPFVLFVFVPFVRIILLCTGEKASIIFT